MQFLKTVSNEIIDVVNPTPEMLKIGDNINNFNSVIDDFYDELDLVFEYKINFLNFNRKYTDDENENEIVNLLELNSLKDVKMN